MTSVILAWRTPKFDTYFELLSESTVSRYLFYEHVKPITFHRIMDIRVEFSRLLCRGLLNWLPYPHSQGRCQRAHSSI